MGAKRRGPRQANELSFSYYVRRDRTMPAIYAPLLGALRNAEDLPAVETWAQLEVYLRGKGEVDLGVALRLWRCYQAWFREQ
jgi:hypothetical protein